jgi:hypothetical protein
MEIKHRTELQIDHVLFLPPQCKGAPCTFVKSGSRTSSASRRKTDRFLRGHVSGVNSSRQGCVFVNRIIEQITIVYQRR